MKRLLRLVSFLCIFISLALPLAACQGAASPTPAAATATPSAEEARRIILQALLLLNTTSNRMNNTTVAADGTTHQNVIEFVPPDSKLISAEGMDTLVVGGLVYLRTSPASPWDITEIPAIAYLGIMPTTEEAMAVFVEGGEYVRADTLDGRAVGVFRYTSTSDTSDVTLHSRIELWVGQADGRPYKMITDGENLKMSVDPATGENKASAEKAFTTTLIEFDPTIKIEVPTL